MDGILFWFSQEKARRLIPPRRTINERCIYCYYPVFSSVAKCRDIDEKMQLCCTAKRPFVFPERRKEERRQRQLKGKEPETRRARAS